MGTWHYTWVIKNYIFNQCSQNLSFLKTNGCYMFHVQEIRQWNHKLVLILNFTVMCWTGAYTSVDISENIRARLNSCVLWHPAGMQKEMAPRFDLDDNVIVFCLQYYGSDTVSICTLDGTVKTILHRIREDLLIYRKCFSGSHLVSWIMHHPELFYQFGKSILNNSNICICTIFPYAFVNWIETCGVPSLEKNYTPWLIFVVV